MCVLWRRTATNKRKINAIRFSCGLRRHRRSSSSSSSSSPEWQPSSEMDTHAGRVGSGFRTISESVVCRHSSRSAAINTAIFVCTPENNDSTTAAHLSIHRLAGNSPSAKCRNVGGHRNVNNTNCVRRSVRRPSTSIGSYSSAQSPTSVTVPQEIRRYSGGSSIATDWDEIGFRVGRRGQKVSVNSVRR